MTEINEYRQNLQPLIISEAERLFRKKGIRSVTMEEISKSLHISKRTIYELYTNKENVLIEVLRNSIKKKKEHLEEFSKNCDNIMDIFIETFRIQLQANITTNQEFYSDLEKYPGAKKLLNQHHEDEHKNVCEFFMQGVKDGYFLHNIDLDFFMRVVFTTKNAMIDNPHLKNVTFNYFLRNYICVIARGLCTQKGLIKFDEFLNNYNNT